MIRSHASHFSGLLFIFLVFHAVVTLSQSNGPDAALSTREGNRNLDKPRKSQEQFDRKAAKQKRGKFNTPEEDKPWVVADRLQQERNAGKPRSTYHPLHWIFLHYHKTGHDLIHHFSEPFRECNAVINFKYKRRTDGSEFANSILKNDDISLLTAPDMLFDWNKYFNLESNTVRIVHFVRDPFDMVISAYLYHAQVPPPPPERWLLLDTFDPCATDMAKTKGQYGSKLQQFWKSMYEEQQYGHRKPGRKLHSSGGGGGEGKGSLSLFDLIDKTVTLCKSLTSKYSSSNYHAMLQTAKVQNSTSGDPNSSSISNSNNSSSNNSEQQQLFQGMRLEAARSILSSSGGDLLRMGANALYDAETSMGRSRRAFLAEFPVGEGPRFYNSSTRLYEFLQSMDYYTNNAISNGISDIGQSHQPFWSCMSLQDAVNKTMAAGYIDKAPTLTDVSLNQRQHVTAGFLSADQKEGYKALLAADPVVGPILTLLQQALLHGI